MYIAIDNDCFVICVSSTDFENSIYLEERQVEEMRIFRKPKYIDGRFQEGFTQEDFRNDFTNRKIELYTNFIKRLFVASFGFTANYDYCLEYYNFLKKKVDVLLNQNERWLLESLYFEADLNGISYEDLLTLKRKELDVINENHNSYLSYFNRIISYLDFHINREENERAERILNEISHFHNNNTEISIENLETLTNQILHL